MGLTFDGCNHAVWDLKIINHKDIPQPIRSVLKKLPGVLSTWQMSRYPIPNRTWRWRPAAGPHVVEGLSSFTPSSGGIITARAALTFESANRTIPLLAQLAQHCPGFVRTETLAASNVISDASALQAAAAIRALFVPRRSDKSTVHDYHELYGPLL